MKLKDLLIGIEVEKKTGDLDVEIKNIQTKSNEVTVGSLFVCISGKNTDSHNLIDEVENFGAVAVVTEREVKCKTTQIVVKSTRKALPVMANNFYGNPLEKLKIIGVTGTNGKTTITYIIKSIFEVANIKCGVIGTLGVKYNGKSIETNMTTPDPLDMIKYFALMVNDGIEVVVMEVSAHSIYYEKINGINFYCSIFTNCTQDHLDFFEDMESYKRVKYGFFEGKSRYIITNTDDELGLKIANDFKNVITYGLNNPSDVFAINVQIREGRNNFVINLFDRIFEIKTSLLGVFNVYNVLASCACTASMGVPFENIILAVNNFSGVPGRLERVYRGDFSVYVDYAHTPDGLYVSLKTLREVCTGRLICLFGCGGNRDSDKRDKMGAISGKNADYTVVTSDNPRFEEPFEIIRQVERGVSAVTENYVCIENRKKAIEYALRIAKPKDVILVAGKGAEDYQEIMGIKYPYSDKEYISEILRRDELI